LQYKSHTNNNIVTTTNQPILLKIIYSMKMRKGHQTILAS
jgi:hypothetical protein